MVPGTALTLGGCAGQEPMAGADPLAAAVIPRSPGINVL